MADMSADLAQQSRCETSLSNLAETINILSMIKYLTSCQTTSNSDWFTRPFHRGRDVSECMVFPWMRTTAQPVGAETKSC